MILYGLTLKLNHRANMHTVSRGFSLELRVL